MAILTITPQPKGSEMLGPNVDTTFKVKGKFVDRRFGGYFEVDAKQAVLAGVSGEYVENRLRMNGNVVLFSNEVTVV